MRSDQERHFDTLAKLLIDDFDAELVEFSSSGLRIQLRRTLILGTEVQVSGAVEDSTRCIPVAGRCQVRWCEKAGEGLYHAGLLFKNFSDVPHAAEEVLGNGADHYELLQVSRGAEIDAIRHAYDLLAQRYHSANPKTRSEDLFRRIARAHEVLSDPARRAAFDVQLASRDQARLHLFENWLRSRGVRSEVLKRQTILRLLYNQRVTDSDRPWIILRDFENLLGCPREYLEFSFWVLRASKLVTCGDGARYQITYQGVTAVEAAETGGPVPSICLPLAAPTRPS